MTDDTNTTDSTRRAAVVTGGSRGIGREVALRLAADGQRVAIAYVSDEAAAEETVATISSRGGQAFAMKTDIADETETAALFDETEARFGGIDVVVDAAGVMVLGPIADFDLDGEDQATIDRMAEMIAARTATR